MERQSGLHIEAALADRVIGMQSEGGSKDWAHTERKAMRCGNSTQIKALPPSQQYLGSVGVTKVHHGKQMEGQTPVQQLL